MKIYKIFINIFILFIIVLPFEIFASSYKKKVSITLKNGDVLTGTLIDNKDPDNTKVLKHTELGVLTINDKDIESVKNLTTKYINNKSSKNNVETLKTKTKNSLEGARDYERSKWRGSISIGLDQDQTYENYSKLVDLDLNFDLTNEKGPYTNSISFNWSKDESKFDIEEAYQDSDSLEIDQKLSKAISYKSLEIYFSNSFDYISNASYGKNLLISSTGLSRGFLNSDNTSATISFGPAIHFVYGGDDCNITTDCGESYFANTLIVDLLTKLSERFKLELNNDFSISYASVPTYVNEFTSTLTFKPIESSGFNTSLEYKNDYREFSEPKFDNMYSLKIGYDF